MLTKSGHDDQEELRPNSGEIVEMDHIIKFDHVPIVTPNGDVLIRSLSFEVKSGMNVLVCFPSAPRFRITHYTFLSGMWP